jgi:cation diffusion facilitator CzcD-associated flavoprotein CzcO
MNCEPTKTPDQVDIEGLRKKYHEEREKRLRGEGQKQYLRAVGDFAETYEADPYMPVVPREPLFEDLDVAILGAGWSGLMAAYHLQQAGVSTVRNVDHAGDFGGVWYWNRYPGLQCDNDAYCYLPLLEEMGFMPSQKFANGYEIMEYCQSIARKYGFHDKALFHTTVTSMRWDESIQRWRVGTDRGDEIRARFVVMANGLLNMPKLPGIPGIRDFKGKTFHTARWDYEYTGGSRKHPVLDKLADKRVAIVGTGATAIQAIPFLGRYAKQLYVLQRTPSTVDERKNPRTDPEWVKTLQPGWQKERKANFHRAAMERFAPGEPDLICDIWTEISRNVSAKLESLGWPELTMEQFMEIREREEYGVMERLRHRVESLVTDKETAETLKPYYRFLCKRPCSNDDFYPTMSRPNVKLIDVSDTKGVERMTEKGFVADGVEYEIDCMIFASGFEVTSDLDRRWGIDKFEGRGGKSIYQHWSQGPKSLHGIMTHGFPNQFFVGFIQGALNASTTEQFSSQGHHIAYVISEAMKRGAKVVEPTQEAQDAYVKHYEEVMMDTSRFQRECTPSYFTNEGQVKAPWALFRSYGLGWTAFQDLLSTWRNSGKLEGLELTR